MVLYFTAARLHNHDLFKNRAVCVGYSKLRQERDSLAQRVSAGSVNGSQEPGTGGTNRRQIWCRKQARISSAGSETLLQKCALHDALLDFECMPSQRILAMRLR